MRGLRIRNLSKLEILVLNFIVATAYENIPAGFIILGEFHKSFA